MLPSKLVFASRLHTDSSSSSIYRTHLPIMDMAKRYMKNAGHTEKDDEVQAAQSHVPPYAQKTDTTLPSHGMDMGTEYIAHEKKGHISPAMAANPATSQGPYEPHTSPETHGLDMGTEYLPHKHKHHLFHRHGDKQ